MTCQLSVMRNRPPPTGSRYCPLLERENGLPLLQRIVDDAPSETHQDIKDLCHQVLDRCRRYRDNPDAKSRDNDEEDDEEYSDMEDEEDE